MSRKILDRYIAKTVLSAIGLVTLMLVGLQIFILFVNQIDDLGRADYGIVQAGVFVLLQIPYQVYLFFPIASLLGCLVGLGVLANHSELVVMRAAGISIGQITGAVLKASLIVILLITSLGETVVPVMAHYANEYKVSALTGGQALLTPRGVWVRNGNDFVSIASVTHENTLRYVNQFRFDNQHNLKLARQISEIKYVNNSWIAYDVKQTEFAEDHTKAYHFDTLPWDVPVKPEILKITGTNPDEMTLRELNRYLREQQRNHQNVANYKFAFFQRITQPLNTMVMMILAIPFIFGPLRSSTMGSKLLVGAMVGFGFHILNRFFGPVSTVFQWPPELAAFSPTLIFSLIGIYLMRRVR
ncbi:TPA: LPS export ABC transporter permease LptG [Legionella pneumophila]